MIGAGWRRSRYSRGRSHGVSDGAWLAGFLTFAIAALGPEIPALTADEADESGPEALTVRAARAAVGDGRSVIPVSVTGGPPARAGELAKAPELPALVCAGAASLPAVPGAPPAVLAPAVKAATTLSCVAQLRGAKTPFKLALRVPPDGLYAEVRPPQSKALSGPIELRVFSLRNGVAAPPRGLRSSASAGSITEGAAGKLTLAPPENRAPRVIAVAMTDGQQFGAAFVPITGTAALPIDATRGADVSVRVAGHRFGPLRARKKQVVIDIEVPAGVTGGVVRATSRRGKTTETLIDLHTPDSPRLAAVAPAEEVRAGESIALAIALATPRGQPAGAQAKIVAVAQKGHVDAPKRLGDGLWTARYHAPDAPGSDELTIRAEGDESAGTAVVKMVVLPEAVEQTPPRPRPPRPRPAYALSLGAHVGVGWGANLGDVSRPRIRAGVDLHTDIGMFEVGLQWLLEFMSMSDTEQLTLDGEPAELARAVRVLAMPILLRARVPIVGPVGGSLGVALVPMHVRVTLTPGFQTTDRYSSIGLAQRAEVGVDIELPRGRLSLLLGVGRAPLPDGLLTGDLERIAVTAGYDLQFADL